MQPPECTDMGIEPRFPAQVYTVNCQCEIRIEAQFLDKFVYNKLKNEIQLEYRAILAEYRSALLSPFL